MEKDKKIYCDGTPGDYVDAYRSGSSTHVFLKIKDTSVMPERVAIVYLDLDGVTQLIERLKKLRKKIRRESY